MNVSAIGYRLLNEWSICVGVIVRPETEEEAEVLTELAVAGLVELVPGGGVLTEVGRSVALGQREYEERLQRKQQGGV